MSEHSELNEMMTELNVQLKAGKTLNELKKEGKKKGGSKLYRIYHKYANMLFRRKDEIEEQREQMNVPEHRESAYLNALMKFFSFKPKERVELTAEESKTFLENSQNTIDRIKSEIEEDKFFRTKEENIVQETVSKIDNIMKESSDIFEKEKERLLKEILDSSTAAQSTSPISEPPPTAEPTAEQTAETPVEPTVETPAEPTAEPTAETPVEQPSEPTSTEYEKKPDILE